MVFNSYTFFVFFLVILALHNLPLSWTVKKSNLLVASYLFYAAWNPPFILLLWLSTLVDFWVGRALYSQTNEYKRKLLLVLSLIGNLGMLCFFKYGGFLLDNFVSLVHLLHIQYHPAKPSIILPAGISFYTFTTLCYTIDMYKRRSEPVKSLLDFSLFVTFFPHLVAGPIVRPHQLVPQFETPRTASGQQVLEGILLITFGLFMKVVLADTLLSSTSDAVFGYPSPLGVLDTWSGVFAFSGQIFFDFAGYSTAAIGAALCLGFILPQNFHYPYAAIGFSDFWRRWHITLSAWLRDYLYIPLGGNRDGRLKSYVNVMITMLIGGLWHGASWTFVAWGGIHGFYLWVEKFFRERSHQSASLIDPITGQGLRLQQASHASMAPTILRPANEKTQLRGFIQAFLTFLLICITWVFFRSATFTQAWRLLGGMVGRYPHAPALLQTLAMIKVVVVMASLILGHWLMRNTTFIAWSRKLPWPVLGLLWTGMALLIILSQENGKSFIYFQF